VSVMLLRILGFGINYLRIERVTLRLVVYRQSVRLLTKPIEVHNQRILFATEPLRS
jgi:hypothetical protein